MTLEEVREAFELWRSNRIKRGPIPESLWLMVQALLPHYKRSQITEALRINSAQFELRCQKKGLPDKTTQGDFALGYFCHQSSNLIEQARQQCDLTLKGSQKSLQISLDISQLAHVLPLMERYL